jgi:hypothetical protein
MRKFLLWCAVLCGVTPLTAQTVDTTRVPVPYKDSVRVIASQDSTFDWRKLDGVRVPVRVDTIWAYRRDSTRVLVQVDTTWRDSVFMACCRDSLVFTTRPLPPPPTASGIDTTGFRRLGAVTPRYDNDQGLGPIPLGGGGVNGWDGQMYFDQGAALAPFNTAIRWFYRDGCWGGTSPGKAWFETGLKAQAVHDVYYRAWIRVSSNWTGHVVGTKLMLLGWGTNGNQTILRQAGSANSASGALRYQISWQGGSARFPGKTLVGNGQPDADGGWNISSLATQPRNQWQKVEIQAHAGPGGTGTSWIKLFVDDKLVLHLVDMDFRSDLLDPYLSAVKQSPVWGGGTSCTAPGGQNLWFADIYVSGR